MKEIDKLMHEIREVLPVREPATATVARAIVNKDNDLLFNFFNAKTKAEAIQELGISGGGGGGTTNISAGDGIDVSGTDPLIVAVKVGDYLSLDDTTGALRVNSMSAGNWDNASNHALLTAPHVPDMTGIPDGHILSKQSDTWGDVAEWQADNSVHKTGDETIGGTKTFSSSVALSGADNTAPNQTGTGDSSILIKGNADVLYAKKRTRTVLTGASPDVLLPASPSDGDEVFAVVSANATCRVLPSNGKRIYAGDVMGAVGDGSSLGFLMVATKGATVTLQWVSAIDSPTGAWVITSATGSWDLDV